MEEQKDMRYIEHNSIICLGVGIWRGWGGLFEVVKIF